MEWKKNDRIQVTIEDMGDTGEGIGKTDGYTWFVKDAVIGDEVEAKVMKTKKSYGFARLEKIIHASPNRVTPRCPVARQCGGCQLQAMDYKEQLAYKERKIYNNITRIGGFDEVPMLPIMGMDEPWRYRNKAQFPWGLDKDGKIITGFYAGRTHAIIENGDCLLGIEENREILKIIKNHLERCQIRPYDEASHTGLIRHTLIRKGFHTGELMVCQVINGKSLPHQEELTEQLLKIPGMTSISVNINRDQTNVILGNEVINLYGPGLYYGFDWRREIPHFPAVILPGKSDADGEALLHSPGICGTDRRRNRVGFILWDRYHIIISCTEGEEGVWRGDRAAGHR